MWCEPSVSSSSLSRKSNKNALAGSLRYYYDFLCLVSLSGLGVFAGGGAMAKSGGLEYGRTTFNFSLVEAPLCCL